MQRRVVRATYRVQLSPDFRFEDVASLADYLAGLGVSHVYCSPYLQAAPGSEHGYDVTIHSRLNEELGGRAGFEKMCLSLDEHGLGHIADIVPNHVAAVPQDPAWWDILKHGRASRFAEWFDIAWEDCDGKILVGILGDDLDEVIERGELRRDGSTLHYFEHRLPLAPGTEHIVDLRELVDAQNYLLTSWKYAVRNLNYRRFFDVSELIALRMEVPDVMQATHRLILELVDEGWIDGLRIDHIDGLRDPAGYLEELRARIGDAYLVVEKILEGPEQLPSEWPVDGTTGYEALSLIGGVLIDRRAEHRLTEFYRSFTGVDDDPEELVRSRKMLIMRFVLPADLSRQARALARVFEGLGWEGDTDLLRAALAETVSGLHVYRTYISPDGHISEGDRAMIDDAVAQAKVRSFIPAETFDRLREVLLLEAGGEDGLDFVLGLQQFTGPVMAKALEDTFFYNYSRFVALNEVGGDPLTFGRDPSELFEWCSRGLLATSTHDTKRSEDVRARLSVLSEIPERWERFVEEASALAEKHRTGGVPERNTEYLLLQNLVGAWPIDAERAARYAEKAIREAKRFTSWLDPDPSYEEAVERYVTGLLSDDEIVSLFEALVDEIRTPGWVKSLSQTVLKLTLPGVPDIYQGCELWDLSLVDPDNRRPVDYAARREMLERLNDMGAEEIWAERDTGAPKLFVTAKTLALRAESPDAFTSPASPLSVNGPDADRLIAYSCGEDVVVVIPRLTVGNGYDATIELPEGRFRNRYTDQEIAGGTVRAADLVAGFPVALLSSS